MIGRIALFVLAVIALGFLATQALEEHDLRKGRALANDPARTAEARAVIRDARAHTLSGEPRILEAQLLVFQSRPADAIAVLRPLTEREPENLLAWRTLAAAARAAGDLTLQAEVRERLTELDPRSAR
ncbi:MAG: hypothetical protein JHC95_03095 [Solirubrobacteraceae bacterium]|nr:hypothetical protein [Solirubrobacteraceae bacterium]